MGASSSAVITDTLGFRSLPDHAAIYNERYGNLLDDPRMKAAVVRPLSSRQRRALQRRGQFTWGTVAIYRVHRDETNDQCPCPTCTRVRERLEEIAAQKAKVIAGGEA